MKTVKLKVTTKVADAEVCLCGHTHTDHQQGELLTACNMPDCEYDCEEFEPSPKMNKAELPTPFAELPDFLTINECAAYTRISRRRIYVLVSQQSIPFSKPTGGTLLFDKHKIKQWLTA